MLAETNMDFIEAKDKQRNSDIGNSVIHWLLEKFLAMTSKDRTTIFQLFNGQKWRLPMDVFHKLHPSVKEIIGPYLE